MMKLNFLIWILSVPLMAGIHLACSDDSPNHSGGDYYPLRENTTWRYERTAVFSENLKWVWDTLNLEVKGDTTFDSRTYKKLVDEYGYTQRIVRSEGSRYYVRTHNVYHQDSNNILVIGYSNEFMFLDSSLPVGASWKVDDNGFTPKTTYQIKSRVDTLTVNQRIYNDVIEVEAIYYTREGDGLSPWRTGTFFYAKNVGEISRFEPSPFTLRYSDFTYKLIKK